MTTTVLEPDPNAAREACADCVRELGLCRRHEKSILPQLAQPGWIRLIVSNYGAPTPPSPEAQKIIDRRARRKARRMAELASVCGDLLKTAAA